MVLLERIFSLIMINLLTCIISLFINFGAFLPYNVSPMPHMNIIKSYIDNNVNDNPTLLWFSDVDSPYLVFRLGGDSDNYFYRVIFPLNNYNSSVSSSIYADLVELSPGVVEDNRRGHISTSGYYAFDVTIGRGVSSISSLSAVSSYSGNNFYFPDDSIIVDYIIYNYPRVAYGYGINVNYSDGVLISSSSFPNILGHTQSGKNEHTNTPLPFPDVSSVSGHSSVSTVDDSNTNNLLGNILNSIQFGSNSIINGVNNVGQFIGNLWGNINGTINYIIEPVNVDEFKNVVSHSPFSAAYVEFQGLKNVIGNMSSNTGVPIEFTLPNSLGGGTYSFNLANYFDDSKHIWQPLLLVFLYASAIWGLYKSLANLINGVSPASDYIRGASSHLYQPPVEIRPKDKLP